MLVLPAFLPFTFPELLFAEATLLLLDVQLKYLLLIGYDGTVTAL
jgi:hypothetical protein